MYFNCMTYMVLLVRLVSDMLAYVTKIMCNFN